MRSFAHPAPGVGHPFLFLSYLVGIKRFFGNISFVVLLNLLVKPGWVVVENLVQDRLGHATFGLVTALSALTLVVAALSDLGLTPYAVQRVAAEPRFMAETFPTLLPLRGALNFVALAAMLVVGWVLGYRGYELLLLGAVGAALLLAQYGQFLRGTLQAHQKFNTDAVLSVLEKFVLLGAVLVLLPLGLTLPRYVGARLGAAAFTVVLTYGLMTRLFGRVKYRWQGPVARTALRASLPFALMTLLYGVNERIDMVMLERLASPTEAGYYAGAYRWVDAVMMYAWTVLPLFFAKFASVPNDAGAQRQLLMFGQRIVTLPMLFIVAFILFRGEVVFWQFTHSTPAEVARMTLCLKILFVNVLVHAFFAIYSTLLTSTTHERAVSWLVALSIFLNIGLNLFLLPHYGAVAASLDTLLCAVAVSVGYLVLVARRTGVGVPFRLLARLLLAFGLLCGAWYGLQYGLYLRWWVEAGIMAAVFGLIVLGTGLVQRKEIRELMPKR
ncbi:polysaccharide biosynthesis C-terminal domain-containing protein [Hymenobacter sp. 5317J-9]|uniref:oligosaccharide flippase family protein n=1 Tax=Hymenobacter sp. 5317J-9 TaxID=2932250 RepID=UPI001FD705FC|nr:oligosaccharide flippase family protein [Hymenobacter sp. 5317J-9]UOQ99498.1 polysaccharide biosynthesis C-terminal domain-containing protein [Hymenobacter sp. 5317J-9]